MAESISFATCRGSPELQNAPRSWLDERKRWGSDWRALRQTSGRELQLGTDAATDRLRDLAKSGVFDVLTDCGFRRRSESEGSRFRGYHRRTLERTGDGLLNVSIAFR